MDGLGGGGGVLAEEEEEEEFNARTENKYILGRNMLQTFAIICKVAWGEVERSAMEGIPKEGNATLGTC